MNFNEQNLVRIFSLAVCQLRERTSLFAVLFLKEISALIKLSN